MVTSPAPIKIQRIPIDRIIVENPRERTEKSFKQLVDSISKVGLKKPITVTVDADEADAEVFHLVCGQGRMEAFATLGQTEIPAIIITANEEDRMLRSVIENIARNVEEGETLIMPKDIPHAVYGEERFKMQLTVSF